MKNRILLYSIRTRIGVTKITLLSSFSAIFESIQGSENRRSFVALLQYARGDRTARSRIRSGGYAALRDEGVLERQSSSATFQAAARPTARRWPVSTGSRGEGSCRGDRYAEESDAPDASPRRSALISSNPSGVAKRERLRGLPAYRRLVGPSAHLHDMRSHGLLRFVAEPACHQAPSSGRPSDRPLDGARRGLGLVLRRRGGRVMALRDGSTSVEELRSLHHPQQGRVFNDLPHDFLQWLISVGHVKEGDDGDVFVEPIYGRGDVRHPERASAPLRDARLSVDDHPFMTPCGPAALLAHDLTGAHLRPSATRASASTGATSRR